MSRETRPLNALAALCANQDKSDHPDELVKFSFRLGNKYDLSILGSLEFNLGTSENYALLLHLSDFSLLHPPKKVGDIDKCNFIVLERALCRSDIDILKRDKGFNPLKPEKYAVFALIKIRNLVGMLASLRIEFVFAGRHVFFIRGFK